MDKDILFLVDDKNLWLTNFPAVQGNYNQLWQQSFDVIKSRKSALNEYLQPCSHFAFFKPGKTITESEDNCAKTLI